MSQLTNALPSFDTKDERRLNTLNANLVQTLIYHVYFRCLHYTSR